MAKILISPSKYLQGAGEMKNIGTYAAKCGKKALVLISQGGYRRIGTMIEESFAGSDCDVVFDYFNGECCESEINRLVAIVKEKGCDRAAPFLLSIQKKAFSRNTCSFRPIRTWF